LVGGNIVLPESHGKLWVRGGSPKRLGRWYMVTGASAWKKADDEGTRSVRSYEAMSTEREEGGRTLSWPDRKKKQIFNFGGINEGDKTADLSPEKMNKQVATLGIGLSSRKGQGKTKAFPMKKKRKESSQGLPGKLKSGNLLCRGGKGESKCREKTEGEREPEKGLDQKTGCTFREKDSASAI